MRLPAITSHGVRRQDQATWPGSAGRRRDGESRFDQRRLGGCRRGNVGIRLCQTTRYIGKILPEFVHSLDHRAVQAMAAALSGGRLPELCRLAAPAEQTEAATAIRRSPKLPKNLESDAH